MHNSGDAQAICQTFGQRTCSNIDCEMAAASKGIETHITKRFREARAGMIAYEQHRLL
jgi:hypothetical protein